MKPLSSGGGSVAQWEEPKLRITASLPMTVEAVDQVKWFGNTLGL